MPSLAIGFFEYGAVRSYELEQMTRDRRVTPKPLTPIETNRGVVWDVYHWDVPEGRTVTQAFLADNRPGEQG